MEEFNLRAIRILEQLTVKDLMEAFDKCQSTVIRMENRGEQNPISVLRTLRDLTGKAPVELVPWLGKPPPTVTRRIVK